MPAFAHTIGSKYETTKDLDITEVAKLIRKDIKATQSTGDLPADAKFSVRIERYNLGQSIDVKATLPDRPALTEAYIYTPEAKAIVATVHSIVDAYGYDNSDTLSDYHCVRFFSNVTVRGTVA